MTHSTPLIDEDGEVREIKMDDLPRFRRGRPPLPSAELKKRVHLMLDPEVVDALKDAGNMSAEVNKILRKTFGL